MISSQMIKSEVNEEPPVKKNKLTNQIDAYIHKTFMYLYRNQRDSISFASRHRSEWMLFRTEVYSIL